MRIRVHARLLLIAALLAMPSMAQAANPFFARSPVSNSDLSAFTKWTTLMPRYEAQKQEADSDCKDNPDCDTAPWETMLTSLQGKSDMDKLITVNAFFNKVPYITDEANFGVADNWQTPYEMMKKGGDCEDYAIAKYISLKRLGIPESSMRIMIVQDQNLGGIMHSILEVTIGGTAYILDNQAQQVIAAKRIFHYQPIYAINESVWWAYV